MVQPFLYYDVYGAAQQIAFVWFGLFGRYASQLLPAAYTDVPHRATLHLGRWRPDAASVGACLAYSYLLGGTTRTSEDRAFRHSPHRWGLTNSDLTSL